MTDPAFITIDRPGAHASVREAALEMAKTPLPEFVAAVSPEGYTVHAVRRDERVLRAFGRCLPNMVYLDWRRSTMCGSVKRVWGNYRAARVWNFLDHENEQKTWRSRRGTENTNTVCPRCAAAVRSALRTAGRDPSLPSGEGEQR